MRSLSRAWLMIFAVSAFGVVLTNCANPLGSGGGGAPIPTPTPTGSPTPTPGPCGTPDTTSSNVVYVGMEFDLTPDTVAPYKSVFGYAVSDNNGDLPAQAGLINIAAFGTSTPITTQNTIQFFNAEPTSTVHSAYGFAGGFPPGSFVFPSPIPSPMATTIASGVSWFTGRVPAQDATGNVCFSPEFKLTKGVYYFGDYDNYAHGFRDVLIVGTPAPGSRVLRHRNTSGLSLPLRNTARTTP
jgi:hypothetical protein